MLTITIGAFRLTSLDDGSFPFPAREFFSNVPEEAWRAAVQPDAAGKIMVGHNCALIDTGRERVLVDTGYGDDTHAGRTGHLLGELARAGIGPDDVTMVVNTHAHGDHAGRNTAGGAAPAFPRARYFLARADWAYFDGPEGEVHHFGRNFLTLAAHGVLTLFDGALTLAPGVSLLPTPGHTPGHTSVLVESGGRCAICLGDLFHHPLQVRHQDWVSSYDTDPAWTVVTRARVCVLAEARNAVLLCPHFTAPGLGKVVRTTDGFAWHPLREDAAAHAR